MERGKKDINLEVVLTDDKKFIKSLYFQFNIEGESILEFYFDNGGESEPSYHQVAWIGQHPEWSYYDQLLPEKTFFSLINKTMDTILNNDIEPQQNKDVIKEIQVALKNKFSIANVKAFGDIDGEWNSFSFRSSILNEDEFDNILKDTLSSWINNVSNFSTQDINTAITATTIKNFQDLYKNDTLLYSNMFKTFISRINFC